MGGAPTCPLGGAVSRPAPHSASIPPPCTSSPRTAPRHPGACVGPRHSWPCALSSPPQGSDGSYRAEPRAASPWSPQTAPSSRVPLTASSDFRASTLGPGRESEHPSTWGGRPGGSSALPHNPGPGPLRGWNAGPQLSCPSPGSLFSLPAQESSRTVLYLFPPPLQGAGGHLGVS